MSWEDILKERKFEYVINSLNKLVYKKYRGDDATKDALSPYGNKMDKQTKIFVAVSKRLDKIAESPTEEKLVDFMTQYLDFNSASAKKHIDFRQGF